MARSPFRTEAAAFRFVLFTLVAFGAIAAASFAGGPWAGVPVWAVVSAVAVVAYLRPGRPSRELRTAPAHVGPPEERRLVLLAYEMPHDDSIEAIGHRADRVLVVAPAVAAPLQHWLSDVDGARAAAGDRVAAIVERLRSAGIDATGALPDEDSVLVVEDALRTFGGDEIVVATSQESAGDAIAERMRAQFALPVTHVVS